MQFEPDVEKCIRNPFYVRKLSKERKMEVLKFLHAFRLIWHNCKATDFIESKIWLEKRLTINQKRRLVL